MQDLQGCVLPALCGPWYCVMIERVLMLVPNNVSVRRFEAALVL